MQYTNIYVNKNSISKYIVTYVRVDYALPEM